MSNSSLVNYTKLSPHYDSREGTPITDITIHHMAGDLTVYQCGEVFQSREASANYGIDGEGRIGLYVPEQYASWANANSASNKRSVTIELANDQIGGDWHVYDIAIQKCIELVADICKRNGITKLNYTGDTSGNLTRHNMFYATACPGPYLQSKFPYIASEVNKRLSMKNGWIKESGYWYYYKNNEKVKLNWAQDTEGKWYFLNAEGKMVKSNLIDWKDNKYYLKSNGVMATGWVTFKNGKRYFDKSGAMVIGWLTLKSKAYYFDGKGYMKTGSANIPCTFGSDGRLVTK